MCVDWHMVYNFGSSVYGVIYRSSCQTDASWTFWSYLINKQLFDEIIFCGRITALQWRHDDSVFCSLEYVRHTCTHVLQCKCMICVFLFSRRANLWRGEPVRRRVRQWATSAQCHTVKNSGAGSTRDQTLRYKPATPSLPRLREQDFGEVQRDGLHLTRCHRWKQTTGHDA